MRFDLSGLSQLPDARALHRFLWVGWGMVIIFVGLGVVGVSYGYYSYHGFASWVPGLALLLAIVAMFTVFGLFFARASRSVAQSLEVDARGFRFEFGDKRPWSGSWNDPRLRLQIVRFNPTDGSPPYIVAFGGRSSRAFLTQEGYLEMQRQIIANGLRMVDGPSQRNPTAVLTTVSK